MKKIVRPERLELPTFRSGVESATNCAIAPTTLLCVSLRAMKATRLNHPLTLPPHREHTKSAKLFAFQAFSIVSNVY